MAHGPQVDHLITEEVGCLHHAELVRAHGDERRLRVGEGVAELLGRPPGVEGHRDGAQADDRPPQRDPLHRVGAKDRDPVARRHAVHVAQVRRQPCGGRVVRGVGEPAVGRLDEVVPVGVLRGRGEELPQRFGAVTEDRHPLAEDVLRGDVEDELHQLTSRSAPCQYCARKAFLSGLPSADRR